MKCNLVSLTSLFGGVELCQIGKAAASMQLTELHIRQLNGVGVQDENIKTQWHRGLLNDIYAYRILVYVGVYGCYLNVVSAASRMKLEQNHKCSE